MTENEKLKHLYAHSGLSRQEIADILSVPINTLHAWLLPPPSAKYRKLGNCCAELLRVKLMARKLIPVDVYNVPAPEPTRSRTGPRPPHAPTTKEH